MSTDDIAISVKGVAKYFKPSRSHGSIKQLATSVFKKSNKDAPQNSGYWALKDVSFDIKKGEFFGIVGKNGSGKSTLLKMMAGVYNPTKGSVAVSGRLIPFIELGVGFNPELSGRDNVFLNGALLGFSRKEMSAMYDEIVQFAELQDHMDVKLKNFSSGMQVRLAFSIAIRAKTDILLIDEVLAVGDAAFQQKCLDYFVRLKKRGATVCLVTHDMDVVKRFCTKAVLIRDGVVCIEGSPAKIAQMYDEENYESLVKNTENDDSTLQKSNIRLTVNTGSNKKKYSYEDKISLKVSVASQLTIKGLVGVAFTRREDGQLVAATNCYGQFGDIKITNNITEMEYSFEVSQLTKGIYAVDVFVLDAEQDYKTILYKTAVAEFYVTDYDRSRWGQFNISGDWRIV